jgi:signal transduction histidine kinase
MILEETTQKIAEGALDTKIAPPRGRNANEITSLAESLEKMRISLKDWQDRRVRFIMGISHDLRTPVALIKGYAEAITDGVVTDMDRVRNSLSIIHTKAGQLEGMINDLINYVKLNNTDWRQSLELVNLRPVLKDFADSAEATAEVYKRTIHCRIDVDPETKVKMDRNLLNRALENLYSNALRYTKDGDSISIEADEDEDTVSVGISDTGIGINANDLEHIWDMFYRGTNSRREAGMGIGLSVVRTIIDTHGWNIDVKSKQGEGTAFTITIPKKVPSM